MTISKFEQDDINKVAWRACDTFRGVIDPAEYKNYILVMLFLKYLSDVWKDRHESAHNLRAERFVLPPNSSFDFLFDRRDDPDIGQLINIALRKIERENQAKLAGVFRNLDFNSDANLGERKDRNRRLTHLLKILAMLDLRPS